ncbi:MAG: nucleoside deaminase [Rikenellaceae bacterium]
MDEIQKLDDFFMSKALDEAKIAFSKGEVPIGAIIVQGERILARAHNLVEALNDATAHAEMQALTSATGTIGGKYLPKCTLYVTLEPCVMCAGALAWSQIGRIVYGAYDLKKGYSLLNQNILHPKTVVKSGVKGEECEKIMQDFFKKIRK